MYFIFYYIDAPFKPTTSFLLSHMCWNRTKLNLYEKYLYIIIIRAFILQNLRKSYKREAENEFYEKNPQICNPRRSKIDCSTIIDIKKNFSECDKENVMLISH